MGAPVLPGENGFFLAESCGELSATWLRGKVPVGLMLQSHGLFMSEQILNRSEIRRPKVQSFKRLSDPEGEALGKCPSNFSR